MLIADFAAAFEQAIARHVERQSNDWADVDTYLRENTWDKTRVSMQRILQSQLSAIAEQ
ncbi:hypothetical protein [Spirosoma fluminis]